MSFKIYYNRVIRNDLKRVYNMFHILLTLGKPTNHSVIQVSIFVYSIAACLLGCLSSVNCSCVNMFPFTWDLDIHIFE